MRKKYLSLFLAVAVAVTSLNSSAMMVAGADFTSGPVEVTAEEAGAAVQGDTGTPAAEISAQSADFTSEGAAVSDTPAVTEQPAVEPEQPVTETVQPEVVTEQPAAETTQPADSFTSEPSAVTEQPAAGTAQPVPEETAPEVTVPEETGAPEENIVVDFGDEVSEEPEVLIEEEAVPVENDALFASEEAEMFSAGDANASVIPLDRLTELALDTEYTVDITEPGGDAWFSFTPAESGAYSFYSVNESGVDSFVYFYDRVDITGKEDYAHTDDDGAGVNNAFRLTRNLEAGKTYYYCAQMYSTEQTGTFRVCLERVPMVTSITATLETSEAAAGIPYSPMASIVLSSDDGKSDVLDLNRRGSAYSNLYDMNVSIVIRDQNGQEYYVGNLLPAGQYTVKFVADTLESPAYALNVAEFTASPVYYGNLAVGENPGTKSSERNYAYYSFTPEETGIYMLRNVSYLEVYAQSDNGYVSVYPDESGYELTAGTTYYFVLWGSVQDENGNEAEECNAELVKQRQVESVTFEPKVNEAYAGLDSGYDVFYGKLTVTYTGASDPYMTENAVTGMYRDEDGHPIELIIEDGAGNYYNGWYNLNPGSYNVTVKCGDVSSQPYTLTVRDPEEAPQIYVGENPVNTAASGYCWYKFVPEATGTYDFNSRTSMTVYEKTEYGNDWVNSYASKYRLTGGISYYVGFNGTVWDDEGNETDHFVLTIELMPELESITATLNTTEAVAGFSCGLDADVSLKYNNGGVGTITWEWGYSDNDDDPYGGGEMTVVIRDEEGNSFSESDVLPAGTYTVKFVRNQVESEETTLTVRELTDSPLYHGELKLGSNPNTLTLDDRYSYYTFIPESTGGYILRNANSFDVWEKTEEGYVRVASGNGDVLVELTAGNTYYFRFWDAFEEWYENDTPIYREKFDAFLEMQSEVQSVTFKPAVTEVYKDLDSLSDAFWGTLRIEYTNGELYEEDKNVYYAGTDNYYNTIEPVIRDADGDQYSFSEDIDVGEYTVSIRCGSVESDPYTLTVKNMDINELPALQVGENTVRSNPGINNWYAFTVPETGVYRFNTTTSGTVRKVEEDGSYTDVSDILWNDETIEKGARYLIGFSTWSMDSVEETLLTIVRKPEVSSLEITDYSPQKLEFIEKIEYAGLDDVTATVSFSDGTSREYKLADGDDFGRWLGYELCRKEADGSYTPLGGQDIPAGDYVFRVYFGENGIESEVCADIPVKVVTLEENVDADLSVEGEEIYENTDGSLLYRFVPETGGRYQFKFNMPLTFARLFDSEYNPLDIKRTDYEIFADLEEGMTYYLYYTADSVYYSQMRVTVNLLTRPSQLKTTALKDHYIAGLDSFTDEDMQTVVANEDGTSRTIRGRDDVRGGYYLQYRVENGEESIGYGETFTPGTWTVTPYLSAYATSGSAVAAIDIPAEETTVVAENVDPTDLPAITEGEWITVPYQGYQRILYAFTPEKAGTYTIENQSEYYISWGFYTPGENGLESTGYDEITLQAEKTYVAVVEFYGASAFRIVEQEESDNPEEPDIPGDPPVTEGPLTLTDGLRKVIDIQEEGKVINCTFTPTEDGVYRIWSEDYPLAGNKDTFAELYCDGDHIYENDDGGSDWNFDFSYYLSAGKDYTYKVRMNSESDLGMFILSFAKVDWKQISDIKLVLQEGKSAEDYTINSSLNDVYERKVIYEDGSVEIADLYDSSDDYGNDIYMVEHVEDVNEERILYSISFTYGQSGESEKESETEPVEISRKNVESLDQIDLAQTYEVASDINYQYYFFTPAETGKYIFTAESDNIYLSDVSEVRYEQWDDYYDVYFYSISTEPAGGNNNTLMFLTAGCTYRIGVSHTGADDNKGSFCLRNAKAVKDLEIVKGPDETTCLPGGLTSLEGMQVKVTYADGTEETVTYTYDVAFESGYGIVRETDEWVDSNTLRVYISVGGYRAGFDLTLDSMDDLPEITVNQTHTFETKSGNVKAVKFVPAETGIYTAVVEKGYLDRVIDSNFTDISYNLRQLYLQKGQTYYLYVFAMQDNPTITVTPLNEHECIWTEVSRTESCTEEGELKEVCTICGAVRVTPIPPQGHNYGEWTETKAATCTDAGEERGICSRCGDPATREIAAAGHKEDTNWTVTKAATCTAAGTRVKKCTVCKAELKKEAIKATGHKFGNWSRKKNPTCTVAGQDQRTCSVCKRVETRSVKATGKHSYGGWTVTRKATALATGVQERTCTVCRGAKQTQTIAKLRPTLTLNVSAKKTIPLKVKQALNVRASRMASGDSVASWKSSNTRVAIVARNGRITGRKAGTATITVRLRSGYSTWFRVKVQNSNVQTTSLRVKNASTGQYMSSRVTLNKYARLRLTPVIAPITSRYKATYTSSNRSVVTVTSSGIVTARKKGAAYVTVKSGRKSVRIRVTVKDPYVTTALRVKNAATGKYITRATLNKYARLTLSPVIAPRTSRQKATYSSSNRSIVTVTSRGVITARRKGTAYVTVKSGVKSVRLRITVKDPYVTTALRVKNAASGRYITRATLRRNARLTLQPVIAPRTSRQKATFASSNRRIVTVNSAGVVTAKRRGTAYITVKSGSKSVRLRITVR